MNKLAVMSVTAYYIVQNWALRELQLALDEVDSSFFSNIESALRITGQGSSYWSMASRAFERSS
jgi:hypothetical protein